MAKRKTCRLCGERKPITEYYKRKHGSRDGHQHECKQCNKDWRKYKECRVCGERKSLIYFYKAPSNKDGRNNMCIECQRIYSKKVRTKPCEQCGEPMYISNGHTICLKCRKKNGEIYYLVGCDKCKFLDTCRVRVKQTDEEHRDWMPPCFVTSRFHDEYVRMVTV